MLEFIKSPDDVLAVKLTGTIAGKDLDAIVDRVEDMFIKPGRVPLLRGDEGD